MFVYAAIRPRFGAGPKTAIIGGVVLWMVIVIFALLLLAMGLHTVGSYVKSGGLYLVSAVVSSLAGAALYKEQNEATAVTGGH